MKRCRILTLARVSPPSWRSESVIAFSEIAAGGLTHPDILLAAPTSVRRRHVEYDPTHAQPEERI
jgi:hypothetical protein